MAMMKQCGCGAPERLPDHYCDHCGEHYDFMHDCSCGRSWPTSGSTDDPSDDQPLRQE